MTESDMSLDENREVVRLYSDEVWGAGRIARRVEHHPHLILGRPTDWTASRTTASASAKASRPLDDIRDRP
jgi:hypothetical protein